MPDKGREQQESPVRIIVDRGETASGIPDQLRLLGADVDVVQLEVGDYLRGPAVIVERKEAADFVGSIMDGRYDCAAL